MPNHLPLEDAHRAAGAVLEELDGWMLPARYGDVAAEHRAARETVAVTDRSLAGKVVVTGRDRQAFLHGMLSNEVSALRAGQGTSAAFLDAHGKVRAMLDVLALDDRLWLLLPPGSTDKTLQALDHFLISEKVVFEAADESFAVLALEGPGAPGLLAELAGRPLDLAPHAHVEASVGGVPARLVRRSAIGGQGYQCWTMALHAEALWRALIGAGARPMGTVALDVLRVEAGIAWYGRDVDEGVILPEARLEHLVSYNKGCYIGQEVVARVKYRGHVNRALSGLVLDGERVPSAGAAVLAEEREIGRITSAVRSIALGRAIALGYVRREHLAPGTAVTVRDGDGSLPARVAALPFVS